MDVLGNGLDSRRMETLKTKIITWELKEGLEDQRIKA
jgi:hypothetical protein